MVLACLLAVGLTACDTAAMGGAEGTACGGLTEAECSGDEPAPWPVDDAARCRPIYGHPVGEPVASHPDEFAYAGCHDDRTCQEEGCYDARTCAHPPGEPSRCWQLMSGAVPDGWTIVSAVQSCDDLPQCNP